jgi:nicotinamidase-related amidase
MTQKAFIVIDIQNDYLIEPHGIYLKTTGWIPNNPRLPVLIYRNVADFVLPDIGAALEEMFERNGRRSLGSSNLHRDFHYHSTAHEVIGTASGSAILEIEAGIHHVWLSTRAMSSSCQPALVTRGYETAPISVS